MDRPQPAIAHGSRVQTFAVGVTAGSDDCSPEGRRRREAGRFHVAKIRLRHHDAQVLLEVEDKGKGIPVEKRHEMDSARRPLRADQLLIFLPTLKGCIFDCPLI